MKLGLMISMSTEIDKSFEKLTSMGFQTCQLNCWQPELYTNEMAELVNSAIEKYGVEITAFWCGWTGTRVWDFYEGPLTLGIVPVDCRQARCEEIKKGADFAKKIGVQNVVTHAGFLPENPSSSEYHSVVAALKGIAQHLKNNGQNFLFETGQETPVTLRRTIEDIGTDNLGINLDPANLILYGKANPVDALDVFGEYVMGIHGKDGLYPTNGRNLGEEVRIGDGKVNYPAFISRLKEIGYNGAITIEREISGDQQIEDIKYAKEFLEKLIKGGLN